MNNYLDKVLDSFENVYGEIYKITNTINNKVYIGQTRTHRKNKDKYRPYGYLGRFNTHISDALCNTKKSQSRYLASSIRLHGKENFVIELVERCLSEELNEREIYYISHYNSMYPNGYNLTSGGKNNYPFKKIDIEGIIETEKNVAKTRGGCKFRSEKTREKISAHLSVITNTPENKEKHMKLAQDQHMDRKIKILQGLDLKNVDENNIDQYISVINDNVNNYQFIRVTINSKRIHFRGKYELLDDVKERAKNTIIELVKQAKLSNCSGNP
jgi:hypothetical protein